MCHSFIPFLLCYSIIHSFIHVPFIPFHLCYSIIRSFIRSCAIHSFIHSFIHNLILGFQVVSFEWNSFSKDLQFFIHQLDKHLGADGSAYDVTEVIRSRCGHVMPFRTEAEAAQCLRVIPVILFIFFLSIYMGPETYSISLHWYCTRRFRLNYMCIQGDFYGVKPPKLRDSC